MARSWLLHGVSGLSTALQAGPAAAGLSPTMPGWEAGDGAGGTTVRVLSQPIDQLEGNATHCVSSRQLAIHKSVRCCLGPPLVFTTHHMP